MDRAFLSPQELAQIQSVLDRFVGLPLTDAWGRWQEMRFEFGEQRPFIDRGGEELKRSGCYLEAESRFKILGLRGGALDESTFYDGEDCLTPLSREFMAGVQSGKWTFESGEVFPDGRIGVRLSDGLLIELLAFTYADLALAETQIVNCWWIGWREEIWSLYTDQLYYNSKQNATKDLEEHDLRLISEALDCIRGSTLIEIRDNPLETVFCFDNQATITTSIPVRLVGQSHGQHIRTYPKQDDAEILADAMNDDSLSRAGKLGAKERLRQSFESGVRQSELIATRPRLDSRGCFAIDLESGQIGAEGFRLVLSHGYLIRGWRWEIRLGETVWEFDGQRVVKKS
ncbi:MAG: hypothetical protein JNM28_03660 [Armatimonadetes bacterium]|nr:hypothetical protein [Armatimonadota bacterium]